MADVTNGNITVDSDNVEIILNNLDNVAQIIADVKQVNLSNCTSEFFDAYKERLESELYPKVEADILLIMSLKKAVESINILRDTDKNIGDNLERLERED